jgi:hypothetical protein
MVSHGGPILDTLDVIEHDPCVFHISSGQGCLCVRPSVSSVCPSDKVHVRPISKYSSIFEHIEHILENIHRIYPLRPIPNRQNRPSVRPSCPSTTSLPPNTSDKTTLPPGCIRLTKYTADPGPTSDILNTNTLSESEP